MFWGQLGIWLGVKLKEFAVGRVAYDNWLVYHIQGVVGRKWPCKKSIDQHFPSYVHNCTHVNNNFM